jgi:hypothetical protein
MKTVLTPISRWGTKHMYNIKMEGSTELQEHDKKAAEHFLEYCDTNKCIRGRVNVKGWFEWPCTECYFNPYNMVESEEKQNV